MLNLTNIAENLYMFWNGFGIPAFPNSPPELAEPPYLIYQVKKGDILGSASDYIRLYYKGGYTSPLYEIADKIQSEIGMNKVIPIGEDGSITIFQVNWQPLTDTEDTVALYGDFVISYNL